MTTTAFDDQFVSATETILARNVRDEHQQVHDLQVRLAAAIQRAADAEAELANLAKQEPVAYVKYKATGGNVGLAWMAIPTAAFYPREGEKLYVAPVPAPAVPELDPMTRLIVSDPKQPKQAKQAPAVPEEWREVMAELVADLQSACDAEHPHRDQYPSVMRKYNNDMEIVEKARALLQSEVTK